MFKKRMFEAKCTDCGSATTVPFKPATGKPVYCKSCFTRYTLRQRESVGSDSNFDPRQAWARRRG